MRSQADDLGIVRATLGRALDPSATDECPVCGTRLDPDDGIWVGDGGLVLRFRTPDCAARYLSNPDRHAGGSRAGHDEDR